jgi:hypothetical protein
MPDPLPAYAVPLVRDGDVVIDAHGEIYQYSDHAGHALWFRFGFEVSDPDHMVARPLTLIARAGRPATGIVR